MTDAAASAARAAAEFFAAECRPGLPAQVEFELAARGQDNRRPDQYDAGLVVSVAALIVAIAQLAQSVYATRRQRNAQPTSEAIARDTRIELRKREISLSEQTLRITDFIATEITRQERLPADNE